MSDKIVDLDTYRKKSKSPGFRRFILPKDSELRRMVRNHAFAGVGWFGFIVMSWMAGYPLLSCVGVLGAAFVCGHFLKWHQGRAGNTVEDKFNEPPSV